MLDAASSGGDSAGQAAERVVEAVLRRPDRGFTRDGGEQVGQQGTRNVAGQAGILRCCSAGLGATHCGAPKLGNERDCSGIEANVCPMGRAAAGKDGQIAELVSVDVPNDAEAATQTHDIAASECPHWKNTDFQGGARR